MPALRSLRFRLIVMFGAVVATAMGVLFLYVVPSLRDDLVSDRLDRLEQVAHAQQNAPGLKRAMETGEHMRRPLVRTQKLANATVTGYQLTPDGLEPLAFAPPRNAPHSNSPVFASRATKSPSMPPPNTTSPPVERTPDSV